MYEGGGGGRAGGGGGSSWRCVRSSKSPRRLPDNRVATGEGDSATTRKGRPAISQAPLGAVPIYVSYSFYPDVAPASIDRKRGCGFSDVASGGGGGGGAAGPGVRHDAVRQHAAHEKRPAVQSVNHRPRP